MEQGSSVAVIDAAAASDISGIAYYSQNAEDPQGLDVVFAKEKPEAVYYLAGAINLRKNIQDPLFIKDLAFLQRTKVILGACIAHQVKKIVFVSSGGAIYENAAEIPTPETYAAHPLSLYGLANLMMEKYIALHCTNGSMDFAIARASNVYGPRQWESGFVPAMILSMLRNQSPIIHGTGEQTRDFVYIGDMVGACITLAEKDGSGVYNVGSGKETSLNAVFGLIKGILGTKIVADYQAVPNSQPQRSALDIAKIKKELGWQPATSMQEGLVATIQWYKAHGSK